MSESYLSEIREQPAVIRAMPDQFQPEILADLRQVALDLSSDRYRAVILTGMGGSLHSTYGLWTHISRSLRTPSSVWDTSELIQQAPAAIQDDTLLIAVSQSGESVELQRLTELGQRPATAISITNNPSNTLARWADIEIATLAGPELTASTKTYTGGVSALYLLGNVLTQRAFGRAASEVENAAEHIARFLSEQGNAAEEICSFLSADQPIFFIGRGASLSSARMGALLTQEAAKLATVAYSGGQFRHGPIEMVRPGFTSILFAGNDHTISLSRKTAADIGRLGGKCLVIAAGDASFDETTGVKVVRVPSVVGWLHPIGEIIPVQLLMVPLARARGFQPAEFLNASKVTSEE